MFSKIRRRFTYANLAMTLALVFAMSGGAYAANKYLITSTKQISPKVLKTLKAKNGSNGAPGAQGPAGPAGPAGAAGTGAPGAQGPEGKAGANGTSVTSSEVKTTSTTCNHQGGSEFTSASGKATACNGKEGSPWTAGGLPKGASEMGQWAEPEGVEYENTLQIVNIPISFTVPLGAELNESEVHFVQPGGPLPTGCKGSVGKPEAESGNLCVFAEVLTSNVINPEFINAEHGGTHNAGKSGTILTFVLPGTATAAASARGTWVVTG
jgi:hypothetical protein